MSLTSLQLRSCRSQLQRHSQPGTLRALDFTRPTQSFLNLYLPRKGHTSCHIRLIQRHACTHIHTGQMTKKTNHRGTFGSSVTTFLQRSTNNLSGTITHGRQISQQQTCQRLQKARSGHVSISEGMHHVEKICRILLR